MKVIFTIILFISLFYGQLLANNDACDKNIVKEGIADLQCWDGQSVISLNGQWHFSFKAKDTDIQYDGFAPVPGRWRHMEPELPYLGRGSYSVQLVIGKPIDGLGLKLSQSDLARKVLLKLNDGSDKLLFDSGNTNLSAHSTIKMYNQIIYLPKLSAKSELIVHVNNSRSIHAGADPIIIGPIEKLVHKNIVAKIFTMLIVSILAVFFVINIYVWLIRGYSLAAISLAGMALAISLRQINVSGILFELFPSLTSTVNSTIGWGSFFSGLVLGTLYLKTRFTKSIPNWLCYFIYFTSTLGVIIFLIQPLYMVQIYGEFYRPVSLVSTLALVFFLMLSSRASKLSPSITMYSVSMLLVAFAVDVIYFQIYEDYPPISISSIGMLLFVGIETLALSNKYWKSIQQTAHLASELKMLNVSLEDSVKEALSEINILRGSLPICSSCKKIRDDKGAWNQIESYVSEHSEAVFSHGMCPGCVKELYPDIYEKMNKEQ